MLRAKKALRTIPVGGTLVLECTDPLTMIDVPAFTNQTGHALTAQTRDGEVSLVKGDGDGAHTAEVIAEADAIRPVLEGKSDGRAAFLAGGIRVRGDVLALQRFSAALGTHQSRRAGTGG